MRDGKLPGSSYRWRPTRLILTEEDWGILAALTDPTPLGDLSMKVAQRCLHLYKAGYLRTDPHGVISLSLHGQRELARRQRTNAR
jgi:hypothetical protein